MALDNANNTCLFGDKFEEKRVKDTNAKQKSKFFYNGLQRKSSNITSGTSYQLFHGSPLPGFCGDRGYFVKAAQRGNKIYSCAGKSPNNKAGFIICASASTKSVSLGAEISPINSRQIKTFPEKLEKTDKRPSDFGNNRRSSKIIFIRTKADDPSQASPFNRKGKISGGLGNSSHAEKRCHSDGGGFSKSIFKYNIFGKEKGLRLKLSNKF